MIIMDDIRVINLIEKRVYNRSVKLGVVFSIISNVSGLVYIGSEYVGNMEMHIMDLCVRMLAFEDMGYIYDASYEVLKDMDVNLILLEIVKDVRTKYELCNIADMYVKRLGRDKCVNMWYSESLLRKIDKVSLYDNDVRIREVEIRKIDLEKELLKELGDNESRLKEYRRKRMIELREAGNEVYKTIIMDNVKNVCKEVEEV